MKIGILTQALHSNYGGLLQNYALQEVLRRMGHQPITIDRHISRSVNPVKEIAKRIMQLIKPTFDASLLTYRQKAELSRLQQTFIQDNIQHTKPLFSQKKFNNYVDSHPMDAYIVGSDQCWRPCYSANIRNYYLDFVKTKAKKIAYAASFGVDSWEYNEEQTSDVSKYAADFDAISMRENSGVRLCKERLKVNASWVLDPTMLLGKDGFMKFITPKKKSSYVLNYLLEESAEARHLVQLVSKSIGINDIRSNIASPVFHRMESLKSHLNISVEQWLSNIYNASFVVTDSFHGAVFSILFNVPFIVKLNEVRGNARLESLLTDFNLSNCICNDINNITIPDFDWEKINAHLAERQKESKSFLVNALN
ncbi:polysaccharide pyruvyl transferase family protein [uncultured Prevotella sp.]|uniref:polysaccharide pyruvyl transferase family protein n=1 Tax=uncultured Prevotella sp. TaxID=159272 RepID=UPI0026341B51|nr:polysaccharide pyruvyl transferase family protein [uncultured Prevotella sp.]